MALQYWQMSGAPQRTRFASLVDAYHGDTLGAVGVGYSEAFHHYYRPVLAGALRLTPPHVFRWRDRLSPAEALDRAVGEARGAIARNGDTLAAVIVEPLMQGAAGMWPHPPAYLRALREATRDADILLIADEVATGFGRTGTMFACAQADVTPDLLCLAKGVTGGYLPLAATLATNRVHDAFLGAPHAGRTFFHGHTYTGNPLGCAAALANLDLFDTDRTLDRLAHTIAQLERRLAADIAPLLHVADVRQCGAMVGIELAVDVQARRPYPSADRMGARVTAEARARGVIVRPLGDVVVLMPPLSIRAAELDRLIDVVGDAITAATGAERRDAARTGHHAWLLHHRDRHWRRQDVRRVRHRGSAARPRPDGRRDEANRNRVRTARRAATGRRDRAAERRRQHARPATDLPLPARGATRARHGGAPGGDADRSGRDRRGVPRHRQCART